MAITIDQKQDQINAIAQSVGLALGQWGMVEAYLSVLFSSLSFLPQDESQQEQLTLEFSSVRDFRTRLEKCSEKMAELESKENFAIWEILRKYIEELYENRHKIAHFVFKFHRSKNENNKIKLALFWTLRDEIKNSSNYMDISDIESLKADFEAAADAISWFVKKNVEIRSPLFRENSLPDVPLIRHFKEQLQKSSAENMLKN